MTPDLRADGQDAADFMAMLQPKMDYIRTIASRWFSDVDDVDDLVQDTLLKAWRSRGTFEPGTDLDSWLYVIMQRRAIDLRSKHRKRAVVQAYQREFGSPVPAPDPFARVVVREVWRILARSPDRVGYELMLVAAYGNSYEEVAREVGCRVETLKTRLHRTRRILASRFLTGAKRSGVRPPVRTPGQDRATAEVKPLTPAA